MNADPPHFAAKLAELNARLLAMGGLVEERLRVVSRALVDRDGGVLAAAAAGLSRINDLQVELDDRCFTLIALHQPVAVDLRTVVSVLKISADLQRVGALAAHIGRAGGRYLQHPPLEPLIDLPRMADLSLKMLRESLDAFVARDVGMATGVLCQDDWLDALKNQLFRVLLTYMLGDPRTIERAVDVMLMSRHFERIGDHATNIAEDVIFIVEGRDVRHRTSGTPPAETGSGRVVERRKPRGAAAV